MTRAVQNRVPEELREVAFSEVSSRDGSTHEAVRALEGAFPVGKEEQLALLDGSTDAAPIDVMDIFGLFIYPGAIVIPQEGSGGTIVVHGKEAAVEIVGPRLGDHRDGGAARHSLLGI